MDIEKIFEYTLRNPLDPIEHSHRIPMKIWTDLSIHDGIIIKPAVPGYESEKLGISVEGTSAVYKEGSKKQTMLELSVNPNNVVFKQLKRITSDVVKKGRVYYFWSSAPGEQNLDVLGLTIRGVSGSILNRVANNQYQQTLGEQKISNPPAGAINTKHQKWMKLWAMTREPAYPPELNGEFNYAYIEYVSPIFPTGKTIIFKGHFSNPLDFEEKAAKPFLIDYNFEFIVHQTDPALDGILEEASKILLSRG